MKIRHGEPSKAWFRSDRYYHTNDGWWFMTREHKEEGPFSSQHEAENELMLYIRKINQLSNFTS
ncbi:DUF6316 family protein [Aliikangiella sp. IMCC44653]